MSQQLGLYLLALLVAVIAGAALGAALTRRTAQDRMRTADRARMEREIRRIRAGAPAAPAGPDPTLSDGQRAAIDSLARTTARADLAQGRRRANPYRPHSRAYACWALSYCDEWNQLVLPSPPPPSTRAAALPPGLEISP